MKKEDMLNELLAMRARIDMMIEHVRAEPQNDAKPEPTYMKLDEFCRRWDISRTTLYTRIGEGLPVLGEGHDRRVPVKDADAWMQNRTGKSAA